MAASQPCPSSPPRSLGHRALRCRVPHSIHAPQPPPVGWSRLAERASPAVPQYPPQLDLAVDLTVARGFPGTESSAAKELCTVQRRARQRRAEEKRGRIGAPVAGFKPGRSAGCRSPLRILLPAHRGGGWSGSTARCIWTAALLPKIDRPDRLRKHAYEHCEKRPVQRFAHAAQDLVLLLARNLQPKPILNELDGKRCAVVVKQAPRLRLSRTTCRLRTSHAHCYRPQDNRLSKRRSKQAAPDEEAFPQAGQGQTPGHPGPLPAECVPGPSCGCGCGCRLHPRADPASGRPGGESDDERRLSGDADHVHLKK